MSQPQVEGEETGDNTPERDLTMGQVDDDLNELGDLNLSEILEPKDGDDLSATGLENMEDFTMSEINFGVETDKGENPQIDNSNNQNTDITDDTGLPTDISLDNDESINQDELDRLMNEEDENDQPLQNEVPAEEEQPHEQENLNTEQNEIEDDEEGLPSGQQSSEDQLFEEEDLPSVQQDTEPKKEISKKEIPRPDSKQSNTKPISSSPATNQTNTASPRSNSRNSNQGTSSRNSNKDSPRNGKSKTCLTARTKELYSHSINKSPPEEQKYSHQPEISERSKNLAQDRIERTIQFVIPEQENLNRPTFNAYLRRFNITSKELVEKVTDRCKIDDESYDVNELKTLIIFAASDDKSDKLANKIRISVQSAVTCMPKLILSPPTTKQRAKSKNWSPAHK